MTEQETHWKPPAVPTRPPYMGMSISPFDAKRGDLVRDAGVLREITHVTGEMGVRELWVTVHLRPHPETDRVSVFMPNSELLHVQRPVALLPRHPTGVDEGSPS